MLIPWQVSMRQRVSGLYMTGFWQAPAASDRMSSSLVKITTLSSQRWPGAAISLNDVAEPSTVLSWCQTTPELNLFVSVYGYGFIVFKMSSSSSRDRR